MYYSYHFSKLRHHSHNNRVSHLGLHSKAKRVEGQGGGSGGRCGMLGRRADLGECAREEGVEAAYFTADVNAVP